MLKQVHHAQITISIGEEEKARDFYCRILGLKEIEKPVPLKSRGGFWLELNGFQIHIGTEEDFDRTKTKAHLAYLVEDLDNCREKLKVENIAVKAGIKIPGFERFEFRDPFGNRVEFLQKV